MSPARDAILARIRHGLAPRDPASDARLQARLAQPDWCPAPARGQVAGAKAQVLFEDMATEASCSIHRLTSLSEIPGAVASYLQGQNLAPRVRLAPHPEIESLDWSAEPLMETSFGPARDRDAVALTCCHAGVAETGTLVLHSGRYGPVTLSFLPDHHIVILKANRIVGTYEEALRMDRDAPRSGAQNKTGGSAMPRTVNFITGPSRTADIEQRIELGAHGPRRLHILLIEDA